MGSKKVDKKIIQNSVKSGRGTLRFTPWKHHENGRRMKVTVNIVFIMGLRQQLSFV